MDSLNKRVTQLENYIEELNKIIRRMAENAEENKIKPYSKIHKQPQFENMDLIFDDIAGMWKAYAIYKDDED